MQPRPKADHHFDETIRELRAAVGQALAATLAKRRTAMRDFIARCGVSRASFYAFLAGGQPSIYLLDRVARAMGCRLQFALVPARLRARPAVVDPMDLAILRQRGVSGRRLIEAVGLLTPVPPAMPTDEQVRKAVARSASCADAARRLDVPDNWVQRAIVRLNITVPFPVRSTPRLSPAQRKERLERIRAGRAEGKTLRELAAELGVSGERIRQIARAAGLGGKRGRKRRRG